MEERIACLYCRNPVYPPPAGRDYACPVCGGRLPRRRGAAAAGWIELLARGTLAAGCLATIAAVAWHLILMPRARTAAPEGIGTTATRQPYAAAEEERHRLRIRQLEQDLERDPHEYGVIVKLATLYTRLGVRQADPARRAADLERARDLFERATQEGVALGRRDFEFAAFQLERLAGRYPIEDVLAEPVPSSDPTANPSPFIYDPELALHMRLDYTRSRLATYPDNARLLCRLGWIYYRLAQALNQRDEATAESWYYESARKKPAELMAQAERALLQATRASRTREYRVEAYQGLVALYQTQGRWEDALAMARKIVALQPNNWPASHRMASILGRLGRREEYQRAWKMASSWRTSEWL